MFLNLCFSFRRFICRIIFLDYHDKIKSLLPFSDEVRRPRCIFDRDDILVNPEERFVSTEADRPETRQPRDSVTYGRSLSATPPRRRSRTRSRSRTADRERRKIADRENLRNKNIDRDKKSTEKERGGVSERQKERSLERDRDKRLYKGRPLSRDREEERYRKRSRTPLRPGEYRPSHSEFRRRSGSRERDHARDKYRFVFSLCP